jgi:hypothetical protein
MPYNYESFVSLGAEQSYCMPHELALTDDGVHFFYGMSFLLEKQKRRIEMEEKQKRRMLSKKCIFFAQESQEPHVSKRKHLEGKTFGQSSTKNQCMKTSQSISMPLPSQPKEINASFRRKSMIVMHRRNSACAA